MAGRAPGGAATGWKTRNSWIIVNLFAQIVSVFRNLLLERCASPVICRTFRFNKNRSQWEFAATQRVPAHTMSAVSYTCHPAMIHLFLAGGSRRLRLPRGPLRHNFCRFDALRLA